ncbi:MAG: ABC transporter substrate-binding protein [Clostridia bacterium]|nr:ABC transporter substrate-binding protein [Clostridia bacterium]
MMKRIVSLILVLATLTLLFASCGGRQDKYADSLRIGTTALPKNLNPYSSTASSSTFFVGLFYNTILSSALTPVGYTEGETYTFPDGSVYTPIDTAKNPLSFTDGLLEVQGALPKEEGSLYGYEYFDPTEEEWALQCERESIRFGQDEAGNEIVETEEEFLARALIAVPKTNWMRFRFKVADGYSWNDGTPFTAADIKFTFDYIIKHAGSFGSQAYFLTDYHKSEVVDGDFVFVLASNNYTSMKSVCNSIVILPKHIWETVRNPAKEKNLSPVGTGAYYIAEGDYIEDSTITVSLREDYDAGLLSEMFAGEPIKNISVILMSNEDVLINALREGSIDLMMDTVKPSKAYAVSGNSAYDAVKISAVNNDFVSTLLFNVGEHGSFREGGWNGYSKEIREAISLAIDQDALIADVLHGMGVKVGDCLVQDYYAHAYVDENGNYVYHKTDVDAANALLDTTSYQKGADGKRDITLKVFATPDNEVVVKALATQLAKLGITIVYDQATSTYADDIKQQNHADFDMIINSVTFTADKLLMYSARYGVYPGTDTVRLFNYAGIVDQTLIDMIAEMELAADTAEQYEKCRAVQKYIADLAIEIPLYSENTITFYTSQKWEGWVEAQGSSIWNSYSTRYLHKVQ